ncbi:MAG: hypothetical protein HYV07_19485 [Deltaproteobacteria bacterium]|nr:hypothetical protein [Deltaproteobacteria bacterium]
MRALRLTFAVFLAGCSEKPVPPSGDASDAAVADSASVEDALEVPSGDSGQVAQDSGSPSDAAAGDAPSLDGTAPGEDASSPVPDAGFIFPDAGTGTGGLGAPCSRTSDCQSAYVCAAVNAGGALAMQCRPPNPGGLDIGSPCLAPTGCSANLCLPLRFGQQCTRPCASTADCAVGFECRAETISALGAPPSSAMICAPTAQGCVSASDCPPGAACAVAPNASNNGLERVCAAFGGSGGGVACSAPNDCRSHACVNGFCAEPCRSVADCFGDQVCQPETVSTGGLVGVFDVCTTFVDLACDANSDCTNGNRVCGDLRVLAAVTPYCVAQNSTGLARGSACTTDDQCRERICHFGSDECTVVCGQDSDCGAGFVCNHIRYNPGNVNIGLCVRTCGDDGACRASSPGNVCTVTSDSLSNQAKVVCSAPSGAGALGSPCTNSSQCQSGFCFTSQAYGASCSTSATCPFGFTCNGGTCFAQHQLCTAVCDNNADCASGGPFSSCQPIDVSGTSVNLCTLP